MKALLALAVRRRVLDRGLRGGSSFWLVVGAFGVLRRLYTTLSPRSERVQLAERLRPGDELTIRYPGKPGRKVRQEQRLVHARRAAAKKAHEIERARLMEQAAGTGRKARQASRLLDDLREPRV